MAVVTTTISIDATPYPIIGIPGNNNIPRRENIHFSTEAIALTGAGDSQHLILNLPLQASYSYVLTRFTMLLFGVDSADWGTTAYCQMFDGLGAVNSVVYDLPVVAGAAISGSAAASKLYTVLPGSEIKKPMVALSSDAKLTLQLDNIQTENSAMTIRVTANFLVYDLDQSYAWPTNTPFLVR